MNYKIGDLVKPWIGCVGGSYLNIDKTITEEVYNFIGQEETIKKNHIGIYLGRIRFNERRFIDCALIAGKVRGVRGDEFDIIE